MATRLVRHPKTPFPSRATLAAALASAKAAYAAGQMESGHSFLDLAIAWVDVPPAEIREALARVHATGDVPRMMSVRESRSASERVQ